MLHQPVVNFRLISSQTLVMEDLIRNVHTLFDERPSPLPSVFPYNVAETASAYTQGSLFLSPEIPNPNTQHHPGLLDGLPTSTQSSFSSLPVDPAMESLRTPSPPELLSPLLGLPSSKTLTEEVETPTQEQVIPEVRGLKEMERLANSNPAEVVSNPLSFVTEWRSHQSRLPPHPTALAIPQSSPESMSDFQLSSATSLQTGMGRFSP